MRIIAGEKGGLRLKDFKGDFIRPTTDKIKGAIFSSLESLSPGKETFVDLFAGTGGMGIEALSRGYENAFFFDKDRRSHQIEKENLKLSGYTQRAEVTLLPAARGIKMLKENGIRPDVIFMDPPYKIVPDILKLFPEIESIARPGSIVILEHDKKDIIPNTIGRFDKIKEKKYGNTVIDTFRMGEEEE